MKKILIYLLAIFLCFVPPLWAFEHSISSGEKTADAVICNKPCFITAVEIITDGTNDARLILYDSALESTSEKVVFEMTVIGISHFGGREPAFPPFCRSGLYADVNGTGASYIIEYVQR